MNTVTNVSKQIRSQIKQIPNGKPFTPTIFLKHGTRESVDQNLSRLAKSGVIERVTRGVYVKPEINRFVGKTRPSPLSIARAVAGESKLQVHGAVAAQRLGLTTQVPMKTVFITSGPTRRIGSGQNAITLQHVSASKLALSERPAGLAITAMWYLGKLEVTSSVISKIRQKIGEVEFDALKEARPLMPGWMSNAMLAYERAERHD